MIIPGVHKGGTTSLYKYLGDHDHFFAPLRKELHHFTPLIYGKQTAPLEEYLSNFKNATDNAIRLDISPSYLYGGQQIIDELKKLGRVKILVILRSPTQRFISFYKQGITVGRISANENIHEFLKKSKSAYETFQHDGKHIDDFYNRSLREGCYAHYITPWLDAFGKDLKIVYFEDLVREPKTTLNSICSWLSIPSIYENYTFEVANKSTRPSNQKLGKFASRFFLRYERFFRKNERLKIFLKKIYGRLNTSNYERTKPEEIEEIELFYAEHNQNFRSIMESYNLNKPNW